MNPTDGSCAHCGTNATRGTGCHHCAQYRVHEPKPKANMNGSIRGVGAAGGAFCGTCNSYNCEHTQKWLSEQRMIQGTKSNTLAQDVPTTTSLDKQVGGNHYKKMALQPWEIIDSLALDFYDGNALKYLLRWRKKGGIEDLKKAIHYIEHQIEKQLLAQAEKAQAQGKDHK